jgi:type II secretory pathway pseudopilin PulG
MKVVLALLSVLAAVSAFAPSASFQRSTVVMNAEAELSRKAFLSAAFSAAAFLPLVANGMDQENVDTPTEQWETGSPTPAVAEARKARFANARTQMTSSFPPIKRLTLERKSPVTRLDINAPGFEAYKKTYPGLFKAAPGFPGKE